MSHVFVCLCAFIVMFDLCVPSLFLNFQKRSQKCEARVLIQKKSLKEIGGMGWDRTQYYRMTDEDRTTGPRLPIRFA